MKINKLYEQTFYFDLLPAEVKHQNFIHRFLFGLTIHLKKKEMGSNIVRVRDSIDG